MDAFFQAGILFYKIMRNIEGLKLGWGWNKGFKGEEIKKHYKNGYKSIFEKGKHISPAIVW